MGGWGNTLIKARSGLIRVSLSVPGPSTDQSVPQLSDFHDGSSSLQSPAATVAMLSVACRHILLQRII